MVKLMQQKGNVLKCHVPLTHRQVSHEEKII
jgi:hypothetical protein